MYFPVCNAVHVLQLTSLALRFDIQSIDYAAFVFPRSRCRNPPASKHNGARKS